MLDRGYPVDACAMSATCCVKAPVPVVKALSERVLGERSLDQRRTAAMTRWKREKTELAA